MPFHICRLLDGVPLGEINLLHKLNLTEEQATALGPVFEGLEDGLSRHGEYYLAAPERGQAPQNILLELLFEQVRQRHYPSRPSRFQSFFATPDESSLTTLNLQTPHPFMRVYEVEEVIPGSSFTANMSLLHVRYPGAYALANAHTYWRGEKGDYPAAWEILIPRTIRVVRELAPIASPLPTQPAQPPSPSSTHP